MNKPLNLFYTISEYPSSGYNKLRVIIDYRGADTLDKLPQRINFYNPFDLFYQSNNDSPADWYGASLEMHSTHIERWETTIKLVKRIFVSGDMNSTRELTNYLQEHGIRYIHDPRLSDYVLNPQAAEFESWHDDHDALNRKYGYTRSLARNEEEAQGNLNRQLVEYMATRPYDQELQDYYVDWCKAGKPVLKNTFGIWQDEKLPDYRTIDQLLNCEPKEAHIYRLTPINNDVSAG